MNYYYSLDLNENGEFEFERFDISTCTYQTWFFNDSYCLNPAHPTPAEIEFIDMIFSHNVSIGTVWAEFAEKRFLHEINK
ncbi:hypothetical protein [Pantoea ananatis]|uniref:hypothetical protein n=1 Tax=Pantoea ananas TaxID=553 RepID=UPI000D5E553F|nr:hypothetical protein [Pantoea ananatis]PVY80222.1 hypothetical protein C7427_11829 [Pantoea ananatis]